MRLERLVSQRTTLENFIDEFHFTFKGSARVAEVVTDCLTPLIAGALTDDH